MLPATDMNTTALDSAAHSAKSTTDSSLQAYTGSCSTREVTMQLHKVCIRVPAPACRLYVHQGHIGRCYAQGRKRCATPRRHEHRAMMQVLLRGLTVMPWSLCARTHNHEAHWGPGNTEWQCSGCMFGSTASRPYWGASGGCFQSPPHVLATPGRPAAASSPATLRLACSAARSRGSKLRGSWLDSLSASSHSCATEPTCPFRHALLPLMSSFCIQNAHDALSSAWQWLHSRDDEESWGGGLQVAMCTPAGDPPHSTAACAHKGRPRPPGPASRQGAGLGSCNGLTHYDSVELYLQFCVPGLVQVAA